jgi:hypothetical protein
VRFSPAPPPPSLVRGSRRWFSPRGCVVFAPPVLGLLDIASVGGQVGRLGSLHLRGHRVCLEAAGSSRKLGMQPQAVAGRFRSPKTIRWAEGAGARLAAAQTVAGRAAPPGSQLDDSARKFSWCRVGVAGAARASASFSCAAVGRKHLRQENRWAHLAGPSDHAISWAAHSCEAT